MKNLLRIIAPITIILLVFSNSAQALCGTSGKKFCEYPKGYPTCFPIHFIGTKKGNLVVDVHYSNIRKQLTLSKVGMACAAARNQNQHVYEQARVFVKFGNTLIKGSPFFIKNKVGMRCSTTVCEPGKW